MQYQRAEPPGPLLQRLPETATDPLTREGVARPCKVLSKNANHDVERGGGEVTVTPLDNGIPQPKPSEGNQRGGEGGCECYGSLYLCRATGNDTILQLIIITLSSVELRS